MGTGAQTERLLLRDWRDEDREPYAALNADPLVMEHFPSTATRAESDAFVDRKQSEIDERGYGLWAAELRGTGEFIGFIGIQPVPGNLPIAPAVEVGWRLARSHWGHGYAPEGARAAVDLGFTQLGLDEILSMTSVKNAKSRRVMEKLGMTYDPTADFDHPSYPDWPERRTVVYRLRAR